MIRLLYLYILIVFSIKGISQTKTDSLLILLKNNLVLDSNRCNILQDLIEAESEDSIWIKYNKEVLNIAKYQITTLKSKQLQKRFQIYLAEAYRNYSIYENDFGRFRSALKYQDSAIKIYELIYDKASIADVYEAKGTSYANNNLLDSAIFFYTKSLKICEQNKLFKKANEQIISIAICLEYKGKQKQAYSLYKQSLKLASYLKDDYSYAIALNCIGTYDTDNGNYQAGIDTLIKSYLILSSQSKYAEASTTAQNIAHVFGHLNDRERRTEYLKIALNLAYKSEAITRIIFTETNLGIAIYEEAKTVKSNLKLSKLSEALAHFDKSLKLSLQTNNNDKLSYNYDNIAAIYVHLHKNNLNLKNPINLIDSAKALLRLSDKFSQENYDLFNKVNNLLVKSDINAIDFKYDIAINELKSALILAKQTNKKDILLNCYTRLKIIYTIQNNKTALTDVLLAYTALKDSIYNDDLKSNILKTEFKYQAEKSSNEIKSLSQQQQIIQLQSKRKSILIYSIIGLVIAITLVSYFIFTRYKTKKQNEYLKTKLEDAELLLIEKQKSSDSEIKAIKSQMNPHFFYNALNSIQGFIYSGDKEKAAQSLGLFSDLSRSVLESSRNTEISLHDEMELLENYLKLETMRLPKIKYTITASESINLHDTYLPAMILQPLVENSVKHGLANKQGEGLLNITFEEKNSKLFIIIDDDGIGRDAAAEIGKRMTKKSASFSTDANMSRIELLNANKKEKIIQDIIDKKDASGNAAGTIVKLVIPIELYD